MNITPYFCQLFSDHLFILFDLSINYHPHHPTTSNFLEFSKGDYVACNNYLLDIDYSFCIAIDIDSAWIYLKHILSIGYSDYIPKIKISSHHPPKWSTSDIRHLLNSVHSHRCRFKRSPTPQLSERLSSFEQYLQELMTPTKVKVEASLFSDYFKNSKSTHPYLSMLTSSFAFPNQVHINKETTTSPLDKANRFN